MASKLALKMVEVDDIRKEYCDMAIEMNMCINCPLAGCLTNQMANDCDSYRPREYDEWLDWIEEEVEPKYEEE